MGRLSIIVFYLPNYREKWYFSRNKQNLVAKKRDELIDLCVVGNQILKHMNSTFENRQSAFGLATEVAHNKSDI